MFALMNLTIICSIVYITKSQLALCFPISASAALPHLEQTAPDAPPHLLDDLSPRQQLREHHDDLLLALHHNHEVVPDLETAERLVDQDVLYLLRGYEPRRRAAEYRSARAGRLDAQPPQHQQGLGRVDALDGAVQQEQAGGEQGPERGRRGQAHGEPAGGRDQREVEEVEDEVEGHGLGRADGARGGRGAAVGRERPLGVQHQQDREAQEQAAEGHGREEQPLRERVRGERRDGEFCGRRRRAPDV